MIETLFRKTRWISGNLCVFYCVVVPVVNFVLKTVLLVTRRAVCFAEESRFGLSFCRSGILPKCLSYQGMWIITIACHQPPRIDLHVTLGGWLPALRGVLQRKSLSCFEASRPGKRPSREECEARGVVLHPLLGGSCLASALLGVSSRRGTFFCLL